MQIAYHFGVHCTDEDRLLRALLKNKGEMAERRIFVPGPGRYRDTTVRAVQKLKGAAAPPDLQAALLHDMLDHSVADRVVLSFEHFICVPGRLFDGAVFYEKIGHKPAWFRQLFSEHEVSFHLAIRNPASLIPAVFAHPNQSHSDFRTFLQGVDLRSVSWAEAIGRMRKHSPDTPVTIWCNEDTPLIWERAMRALLGVDETTALAGATDLLAHVLQQDHLQRYEAALLRSPPDSEEERLSRIEAALEAGADPEVLELAVDIPEWTADIVDMLTERYESEIDSIADMPNVTMIRAE